MQIQFRLNPAALPALERFAEKNGLSGDSTSLLCSAILHHLAGVEPLPRGGSRKGAKLNITPEESERRRKQAAKARARIRKASA